MDLTPISQISEWNADTWKLIISVKLQKYLQYVFGQSIIECLCAFPIFVTFRAKFSFIKYDDRINANIIKSRINRHYYCYRWISYKILQINYFRFPAHINPLCCHPGHPVRSPLTHHHNNNDIIILLYIIIIKNNFKPPPAAKILNNKKVEHYPHSSSSSSNSKL